MYKITYKIGDNKKRYPFNGLYGASYKVYELLSELLQDERLLNFETTKKGFRIFLASEDAEIGAYIEMIDIDCEEIK